MRFHFFKISLWLFALMFAFAAPAQAMTMPKSEMALIGGSFTNGAYESGLEISMQKGVKTYWKNPGSSGIPPDFDWSKTTNVKSIEVLWPTPTILGEGDEQSLGYYEHVIVPLRITPADPSKDVTVHLHLNYAICSTICVPAHGQKSLTLTSKSNKTPDALKAAFKNVPKGIEKNHAHYPKLKTLLKDDGQYLEMHFSSSPTDLPKNVFIDHLAHGMGYLAQSTQPHIFELKLDPKLLKNKQSTQFVVATPKGSYAFSLDLSTIAP